MVRPIDQLVNMEGNMATKRSKVAKAVKARTSGLRQFNAAGRPSKSDFVKVFGKKGPAMTWAEREAAGIPAEKFQSALAAKRGR